MKTGIPNLRASSALLALVCGMAVVSVAKAQTAEAETETGGITEIVVTAQKKAENLQDVPIAISAVDGESLARQHVNRLDDIKGTLPNVQLQNYVTNVNTVAFSIRGMGSADSDPYIGTTVVIVEDGTPLAYNQMGNVDVFDVARIEVLRGPQGTLFGANTTGGVVSIVSRLPTNEFEGNAEIIAGNYNRIDAKAALNFPIIDGKLAGRIAFMHHSRKGFVTNVVDGTDIGSVDRNSIRASLALTPGGQFDANLVFLYSRGRNGQNAVIAGANTRGAGGGPFAQSWFAPAGLVTPGNFLPNYVAPCQSFLDQCHAPDKYLGASQDINTSKRGNRDLYSGTLTMNLDTSIGKFTSISGYKWFRLDETQDQDGTPIFFAATNKDTKGWQITQELRNQVDISDDIQILFGGYFQRDHYFEIQNFNIDFSVPGGRQQTDQYFTHDTYSAFAQTYIQLTDKLRAQAGIRYSHDKTRARVVNGIYRRFDANNVVIRGPYYTGGTLAPFGAFDTDTVVGLTTRKSWNDVAYKAGLDYRVTRDVLLYGYYAHGFKTGGFVTRITNSAAIGPFEPEKVDSIEGGIKSELFGRRLRINLAAFHNWYKDLQIPANFFVPIPGTNQLTNTSTVANAANAKTYGFEAEILAIPVDGLTLNANVGYLKAKYVDYCFFIAGAAPGTACTAANGGKNMKGLPLNNAPEWSINLGFLYEVPVAGGTLSLGSQYKYTSSKYNYHPGNTIEALIQPTHYVDATVEWQPESERFTLGLWATNLLDNRYMAAVNPNQAGYLAAYAPPRQWGASFRYNW